MDHLLLHYEYELGLFARALGDFAIRYPKIAARLGIQSGRTDDPHVTRLIQTFSFLAAHLDSKLADDYPEFTGHCSRLSTRTICEPCRRARLPDSNHERSSVN